MAENQSQVPVVDPAAPAAPGAPAISPPEGSLAASLLPPGSAVPPVDPGAPQAPPTGEPKVDPSVPAGVTPPAPPAQEPPTPEFIPRAVHEEQFRSLQSAKDKEIADLRQQLQTTEAQPATPQGQPAAQEEFSNETFFKKLDSDPKGAMAYLTDEVRRSVMADVQSNQQQQDAYSQYVATFNAATEGFTPEERQRAEVAVQDSFNAGRPVTPAEAAMTGRFGSVDNAMAYAQQHMSTLQPAPGAAPAVPPAVPPVVPGTTPVQVPPPQDGQYQDPSGTYKSIFAD